MDYEKRYNDALKRAKAAIDIAADKDLVKGIASTIFPELRESEDERIRKELIMAFEAYDVESSWNGLPVKSILAWLEKQKTYKPTEEDERKRKMLIETIDSIENFPNKGVAIAYLEKQKPQDTVGSVSVEIRSNLQKDEVVRKTLIMLVDAGRISVTGAITSSDILNWLEGQKEPEEDLEKEINKWLDGPNTDLRTMARHFAEWQKSQMLKDAFVDNYVVHDGRIELEGDPLPSLDPILLLPYPQFKPGDKVRIVVLKAEEEKK